MKDSQTIRVLVVQTHLTKNDFVVDVDEMTLRVDDQDLATTSE